MGSYFLGEDVRSLIEQAGETPFTQSWYEKVAALLNARLARPATLYPTADVPIDRPMPR